MSESAYYDLNRPQVIAEKFDDEYVIVNLKSGAYYGLRGSGARIWELLARGADRAQITSALAEQFDADPTTLAAAVANLLLECEHESLIVPSSAPSPYAPTEEPGKTRPETRAPFSPPILEKHLDMQEVLQLDPIHEVDDVGWPKRAAP